MSNPTSAGSSVIGATIATFLGIGFFNVIIGVLGLKPAIAGLLFFCVLTFWVYRTHADKALP